MDEFLSEKEQIDQIREWWRENGWYLIGGVALGVLVLLGWNRFNAYQDARQQICDNDRDNRRGVDRHLTPAVLPQRLDRFHIH